MNWFKENKFLGGLLVVTLILSGLIIFLGLQVSGNVDETLAEVEQHKSDKQAARQLNPFPSAENVEEKLNNVKKMVAQAESAQSKFLAFRPKSIDNIAVGSFADRLKNADANVRAVFEENNVRLSEKSYLGFEEYKGKAPIESVTGILAYEVGAIESLFIELAKAGITEVQNFRRDKLAEETAAPEPTGRRSRRPARGSRNRAKQSAGIEIAKKLPMSLTIEGSEKSIRAALEAIANSDEYFFEARVGRIQNPAAVPNSSGVAVKKKAVASPVVADDSGFGVVDSGFGAIAGDDADDAGVAIEEVATVSEKILHRVAGGQNVSVFLKLDLLLFSDEKIFPAIK